MRTGAAGFAGLLSGAKVSVDGVVAIFGTRDVPPRLPRGGLR